MKGEQFRFDGEQFKTSRARVVPIDEKEMLKIQEGVSGASSHTSEDIKQGHEKRIKFYRASLYVLCDRL